MRHMETNFHLMQHQRNDRRMQVLDSHQMEENRGLRSGAILCLRSVAILGSQHRDFQHQDFQHRDCQRQNRQPVAAVTSSTNPYLKCSSTPAFPRKRHCSHRTVSRRLKLKLWVGCWMTIRCSSWHQAKIRHRHESCSATSQQCSFMEPMGRRGSSRMDG